MKAKIIMSMTLVAMTTLLANVSMANGNRAQSRSGNANGAITRTGTATQTRQQLRDGSCVGTAVRDQDRKRLRDGAGPNCPK